MKINTRTIRKSIDHVKRLLEIEESLSPALKKAVEQLLLHSQYLVAAVSPGHSNNSHNAPSGDPDRDRGKQNQDEGEQDSGSSDEDSENGDSEKDENTNENTKRSPGGQPGRKGVTLRQTENPDAIISLTVPKELLPPEQEWTFQGYERRQVFDVEILIHTVEYQAEVYTNKLGEKVVAAFPDGVNAPVQYGPDIRAMAVYNAVQQYQGFQRSTESFSDLLNIPLSKGSIGNFRQKAYELLAPFEDAALKFFIQTSLIQNDETGVCIDTTLHWIHSISNERATLYFPHEKRGKKAMDEIGVLAYFKGVSVHDGWGPYFAYCCMHALCGAHLLRDLQAVIDVEGLMWAADMKELLLEASEQVKKSTTGILDERQLADLDLDYETIIDEAELTTPWNEEKTSKGTPAKQTKSRNLLHRFIEHKEAILLFTKVQEVPFTNNLSERDIRMIKLYAKISGSFRTFKGALSFCRIRAFISTCKKNNVPPIEGLRVLFTGQLHGLLVKFFPELYPGS